MKGRAGAAVTFLLSLAVVVMVFLLPPRWLALPLFVMASGLFLTRKDSTWSDLLAPVLMTALAAFVFLADSRRAAMAYPVVVNLGLLAYFYGSLRRGQTAIERLARIQEPELPREGVRYTRSLTKIWCAFFVLNGGLAVLTVWHGDAQLWAVYNGVIAYLLIGGLVLGERLFRPLLMRRFLGDVPQIGELASRLLATSRSDEDIVCFVGEHSVDVRRFRQEVAARVRLIATGPPQEWIMDSEDGHFFAADLLAVCLSGGHAIVPQNHQLATLAALRERYPNARMCRELASLAPADVVWRPFEGGRISFHTSGSSGEPKCITRKFAALVAEAVELETLFGGQLGSAQVIGTVPHHFIYGTIFRIIWPLWAGRVFRADPLTDGYAVLRVLRSGRDFALVSSPSLLERVPPEDVRDLERLRLIFSSGSLLRSDVAMRWGSPVEVYGSTETGGVAWRRQVVGGEPWQVFPRVGISVGREGRLRVDSPFVAPGAGLSADSVRLVGKGRFELHGRVDRIAKVEGRRVSLPELESIIEGHSAVHRCVIFQSEGHARLAAIIVPCFELSQLDYAALTAELLTVLRRRHDAVVAPRRWKILPRVPRDARGKASLSALRTVFGRSCEVLTPESGWPQLLGHRRSGGSVIVSLRVPPGLPVFAGHFPGLPILPGVTLLDWAALLAETYLGVNSDFTVIDNLKFTAAVYPGESLELTLSSHPEGVRFRYEHAGQPKASGALLRTCVQNA